MTATARNAILESGMELGVIYLNLLELWGIHGFTTFSHQLAVLHCRRIPDMGSTPNHPKSGRYLVTSAGVMVMKKTALIVIILNIYIYIHTYIYTYYMYMLIFYIVP